MKSFTITFEMKDNTLTTKYNIDEFNTIEAIGLLQKLIMELNEIDK